MEYSIEGQPREDRSPGESGILRLPDLQANCGVRGLLGAAGVKNVSLAGDPYSGVGRDGFLCRVLVVRMTAEFGTRELFPRGVRGRRADVSVRRGRRAHVHIRM